MSGPGKKWRWALMALGIIVLFLVIRCMDNSVEVSAELASRQAIQLTVTATATGTIKSDTEVKVTAQRIGRVSTINVVEGDIVKAGDIIAELDPTEASINLARTEAGYEKAEAMLRELKAKHEVLEAEVAASNAMTASRLQDARSRFERYSELNEKGFISKDEFDAARTEFDVAKAEYESSLSGTAKLSASASDIEAQEGALKEAREALKLARLDLSYSYLKAPIDSIVTSVPVKRGERLMEGSLVAELIATESLYVEAFIDEADVAKVKTGQEVLISMDAYPGASLHGEVYMISPVVLGEKHETRTFEMRTRIEEDVNLKPGMSADVEIVVGRVEGTLAVPSQAVIERNGGHYVYVMEGSRASLRKVGIGLYNWTLTEVTSGIKEGEMIIVTPDVKGLEDGARVSVRKGDQ